eukprot:1159813-Pelagomonas_calceolata.AAC.3
MQYIHGDLSLDTEFHFICHRERGGLGAVAPPPRTAPSKLDLETSSFSGTSKGMLVVRGCSATSMRPACLLSCLLACIAAACRPLAGAPVALMQHALARETGPDRGHTQVLCCRHGRVGFAGCGVGPPRIQAKAAQGVDQAFLYGMHDVGGTCEANGEPEHSRPTCLNFSIQEGPIDERMLGQCHAQSKMFFKQCMPDQFPSSCKLQGSWPHRVCMLEHCRAAQLGQELDPLLFPVPECQTRPASLGPCSPTPAARCGRTITKHDSCQVTCSMKCVAFVPSDLQGPLGPEALKARYGLKEPEQLKLYRVLYSYTVRAPAYVVRAARAIHVLLHGVCASACVIRVLLPTWKSVFCCA